MGACLSHWMKLRKMPLQRNTRRGHWKDLLTPCSKIPPKWWWWGSQGQGRIRFCGWKSYWFSLTPTSVLYFGTGQESWPAVGTNCNSLGSLHWRYHTWLPDVLRGEGQDGRGIQRGGRNKCFPWKLNKTSASLENSMICLLFPSVLC